MGCALPGDQVTMNFALTHARTHSLSLEQSDGDSFRHGINVELAFRTAILEYLRVGPWRPDTPPSSTDPHRPGKCAVM
jgi:hypothetical protein